MLAESVASLYIYRTFGIKLKTKSFLQCPTFIPWSPPKRRENPKNSSRPYKPNAEGAKQTRLGKSEDQKMQAVLTFTFRLLAQRGNASAGDLSLLRIAGFHDNQIVEILGVIGLNMFTNYLVKAAGTEIDFPVVDRVDTPSTY